MLSRQPVCLLVSKQYRFRRDSGRGEPGEALEFGPRSRTLVKARLLMNEWTPGAYRSMVEDEKAKKHMKVYTGLYA